MVSSPTIQNQELRAEGSPNNGRPVEIALDFTTALDVTLIHVMSVADVLDKVWLTFWNDTDVAIDVSLIISPNDDTVVADVNAATVLISVPPKRPYSLPEFFVRFDAGGNTYVIATYVATADINNVRVTKRVVRLAQGALTL